MFLARFVSCLFTGNNEQDNRQHRGFAFITFATQLDAQDAIDNMDNNELRYITSKT